MRTQKKTSKAQRKSRPKKQKVSLLKSSCVKYSRIENYRAFFRYILSDNIDGELSNES